MNPQNINFLWAIYGPVFLILGWWVTWKNISSIHVRIVLRSLVIATAFGFIGIGTDSAAIIVPAWSLLTPAANFVGIVAILFWWVIVLLVYYVFYLIYKMVITKK